MKFRSVLWEVTRLSTLVDQYANYGLQRASRTGNGRSSRTLRSSCGLCRVFVNWLVKWYKSLAYLVALHNTPHSLVHQRVVSKAIMVQSIINDTAPEYQTSRFVRRFNLASYNLRENEYKLAVPQPGAEFYKGNLSYSGYVLWNSVPLEVR